MSADNLELSLEVYDDSFATASTFNPDEFCQCLSILLPETVLTEDILFALIVDLRNLQSSLENEVPEPEIEAEVEPEIEPGGSNPAARRPSSFAAGKHWCARSETRHSHPLPRPDSQAAPAR